MTDSDSQPDNRAASPPPPPPAEAWPALPYEEWKATYETLHMWTQVVGKIRLALSPPVNHWWHCALYLSARGLTTSPIPYRGRIFEIGFDFLDHHLDVQSSDGRTRYMALYPRPVADFYKELMAILHALQIDVTINTTPQEVPNPIACDIDTVHASYDPEAATRCWRILVATDSVFKEFRGRFLGKCSPVHFWWGSFDLAVTRFTGKRAPDRPGADRMTREAYSHECSSAGFWPGNAAQPTPVYYAYTVPEPAGLRDAPLRPASAYYDAQLSEFILPYDAVRGANRPREVLLDFLQSTYVAGADRGGWDRAALERQPLSPG
ncbi:MAG TPA: DUF5996 family protein [Chloroflexia bacterium]|nr:DUF5996 family protein [Chloroflexia bacterium]